MKRGQLNNYSPFMKRQRKVFGRREADIDGRSYRFELRHDGLWVLPKYARKSKLKPMTFADLVDHSQGQLKLL